MTRRRPRLALALLAVAILGVAAIVATPLVERAIRHFSLPLKYASIIRQQATEKRLDPALIAAVIYAETRFSPRTSPTGAEGLMQIEPATAMFLAHRSGATSFTVADLGTPQVNIAYGSYYLRYLLDEYGGSTVLALAAYNSGEANVDKWISHARAQHINLTVSSLTVSSIPQWIRPYVTEVLSKERSYRSNYATELGYRP
jgi:soluble lytic murein transglycosylase